MLIGAYRPLYRASIGLYGYKTPFFSLYRPYRAPIGLITILSIIFLTTNLRFLKSFKKVAVEACFEKRVSTQRPLFGFDLFWALFARLSGKTQISWFLPFLMSENNLILTTFLSFLKISDFWGKFPGESPSVGYAIEGPKNIEKPRFTADFDTFIAYRLWSHFGAKKKSNTKTNLLKILTRGIPVKIIYLFYIYISITITQQSNFSTSTILNNQLWLHCKRHIDNLENNPYPPI